MNLEKVLQNVPDSVLQTVAEKAGVSLDVAKIVVASLAGEMKDTKDWAKLGKDLLDRDSDGEILDDLGEIASSWLGKK